MTTPQKYDNGLWAREQLAHASAARHARAGRYDEAERLLLELDEPRAGTLDLLARVYAQQGRLPEAREHWERAGQVAGEPGAYTAELRRVDELLERAERLRRRQRLAGAALVGALLGAAAVAVVWPPWASGDQAGPEAPAPVASGGVGVDSAAVEELAGEIDELQEQIQELPQPEPGPEPVDVLAELSGALTGAGLTPRPTAVGLDVSPQVEVFSAGTDLTPDGERALNDLGGVLGPYAGSVAVSVTGHTDDRPVRRGGQYESNLELGQARAAAAIEVLSAASGIPLDDIASLGGGRSPFPDDAPENRTVTVTITSAPAVAGQAAR